MRTVVLLFLFVASPASAQVRRVLFVGNSLTYTNDLPAMVRAVAAQTGDDLVVASATGPNLALIDHLHGATDAVARITNGRWDFVVLQQGPTTVQMCRDSLVGWTRAFDTLARAAGGRPALLMTWPVAGEPELFDAARGSFEEAAGAVGGVFIPVGEAWRIALAADSGIGLYGPDGFHPSATGTWLAAMVIVERLSGRDVRTLPAVTSAIPGIHPLAAGRVRLLQRAAHEANQRYPAHPPPNTVVPPGRVVPGLDRC
jgi:hypothetical protein